MLQQFQPGKASQPSGLATGIRSRNNSVPANGLVALSDISASMQVPIVHDIASLRHFLASYQKQLLLPIELPAIQRAFDTPAARSSRTSRSSTGNSQTKPR